MDRAWLRWAQKLEYRDPASYLLKLRQLEPLVASSELSSRIKQLRTNELKSWRELREAALFCYGMGRRIGQPVYLAKGESQDYDFVASWVVGDEQHFAPVQLKEVVPVRLNAQASLKTVVQGLTKYVDSENLTVAVHLNQRLEFDPTVLVIPRLRIASLWIFAAIDATQSRWGLWGNFIDTPIGTSFEYPEGP